MFKKILGIVLLLLSVLLLLAFLAGLKDFLIEIVILFKLMINLELNSTFAYVIGKITAQIILFYTIYFLFKYAIKFLKSRN